MIPPRRARDVDLEAIAREVLAEGRGDEAVELLSALSVNLARHEPGPLPCLCGRCDERSFEASAMGERFSRDFVVAAGHHLWFWAPAEIASPRRLRRLRASMQAALADRLRHLKTAALARRATEQAAARALEPVSTLDPDDIPF